MLRQRFTIAGQERIINRYKSRSEGNAMSSVYIPTKLLSFEEYLTYDDGSDYRYELLDTGELVELPYENQINVILAMSLARYFEQFVHWRLIMLNTTAIQVAPTTITLADGRRRRVRQQSRIPDLMILTQTGERQIFGKPSGVALHHDNPTLIVEVVSESNASEDYVDKRIQYEARGVSEYWIVDRHQQKVTVLTLENDRYKEAVYQGNAVIQSKVFPGSTITVESVITVDEM